MQKVNMPEEKKDPVAEMGMQFGADYLKSKIGGALASSGTGDPSSVASAPSATSMTNWSDNNPRNRQMSRLSGGYGGSIG